MNEHITKPLNPKDLVDTLIKWLVTDKRAD